MVGNKGHNLLQVIMIKKDQGENNDHAYDTVGELVQKVKLGLIWSMRMWI